MSFIPGSRRIHLVVNNLEFMIRVDVCIGVFVLCMMIFWKTLFPIQGVLYSVGKAVEVS